MCGNIKAVEYRVNLKILNKTTCYNKKSRRLVLRLSDFSTGLLRLIFSTSKVQKEID